MSNKTIEEAVQPTEEKTRRLTRWLGGRSRRIALGLCVLGLILAGLALWSFVIRDDSSATSGQVSVPTSAASSSGAVQLPQNPSLAVTATIDGSGVDETVDLVFDVESTLVVTVTNDGNVTMDDITAALEYLHADGTVDKVPDECEFPRLSPGELAECSLQFTPTKDVLSVVARILGYGPQRQEVDLPVTVAFG